MSKFTHLHVHSHYSLLDGLPKIDELLDYVKEQGMDSVALTDHGVIYGAVEFYKKAVKKGIKPIIGCETYLAYEKMSQKRPNVDTKRYHLVLLVKNRIGYENLVKLLTKAHLEGFYYKPRIDEEILAKHSSGLIGLSACLAGKIPQLILSKRIKEAEKLALKYQQIFGEGNFYLEIQHHPGIPGQEKVNKVLISLSEKLGIPLVATNDCHYLRPEDAEAQDILMLINTGAKIDDPKRPTMKTDDFSLRPPKKMIEDFKDVPQAIENTQKIVEKCNFKFELGKTKLPLFEVPSGKTPDNYIEELCQKGLKERNIKPTKEVSDRLNYELSVIKQTGFASYFLIVQDFVNWAKENRIVVGPGRGSAAGSLVSYLLKITNVNPLKYDLLFERFLNPERVSMPDIDLDFADRRRNEVIEYVSQKYGKDHVAQIITFGTMAARAVIRDVGRALGYTYGYCDKIAKMIPFGFTLAQTLKSIKEFSEIYKSDEQARKLIDLAKKLEGVARHASTHACGVVISDKPLTDIVPLQHPTQDDTTIVTQYEMHSIEDLGLLKMDFLGLKNLTIIEATLARIYKVQGINIDIENLPLDDEKTFQLLQKANTTGVFQLESDGMKRYLKQLKPTEFEDIIAMVALYRPGPMQFIPDYIAKKQGKQKIKYLHPSLKPILEKTYGTMIYQEQIMQIAQVLAGFSLSEADVLRKAIGKKIKKLLFAQKKKFIEGAVRNKVSEKIATEIWKWIEPSARYSFNKSHATCYATIAYQTAYLKAHYPVEYMAALLTSEKNDIEKIAILIEECRKMGIEILPPDINESFSNFSVVPNKRQIRFGLLAIKNVGSNVVETIIQERKSAGQYKSIYDFISRVNSKDLNKRSLESLIKSGVFDSLEERNKLLFNLEKLLQWSRETQKTKTDRQKGLFDKLSFKTSPNISLETTKPATNYDKLNWEKELLGLYISGNPLKGLSKILKQKTLAIKKIKQNLAQPNGNNNPQSFYLNSFNRKIFRKENVTIGGIITHIKKILTKTGKQMLFLKLQDLTDAIEIVVFPSAMENNLTALQENKIVFIKGKTDIKDGVPKIIANEVEEIINHET